MRQLDGRTVVDINMRKFETLKPYVAAICASNPEDVYGDDIIRLALNENPYGISPAIKERIIQELENYIFYPDGNSTKLKERIAEKYKVAPEMVLVGNGIDELILIASLAFLDHNDIAVTTANTFFGYFAALEISGAIIKEIPIVDYRIDALNTAKAIEEGARLVFLCNPHNPAGTILSNKEVRFLINCAERHGTILVFDEAYWEYVVDESYSSVVNYIKDVENVVVFRTFSKMYGLAGLRCGYAIAPQKLIDQMACIRNALPFNTNRLAQKASLVCLSDDNFVNEVKYKNDQTKKWFCKELERIGWEYIPSVANFVLVKTPFSSHDFCRILLSQYKIAVKNGDSFGLDNHVRISIGLQEQMEYLVKCIEEISVLSGPELSLCCHESLLSFQKN